MHEPFTEEERGDQAPQPPLPPGLVDDDRANASLDAAESVEVAAPENVLRGDGDGGDGNGLGGGGGGGSVPRAEDAAVDGLDMAGLTIHIGTDACGNTVRTAVDAAGNSRVLSPEEATHLGLLSAEAEESDEYSEDEDEDDNEELFVNNNRVPLIQPESSDEESDEDD